MAAAVWWFLMCLRWDLDLKAASGLYLLAVVFTLRPFCSEGDSEWLPELMWRRWIAVTNCAGVCFRWKCSRVGWRVGGVGLNLWGGCCVCAKETLQHIHTFPFNSLITFTPTYCMYSCAHFTTHIHDFILLMYFSFLPLVFVSVCPNVSDMECPRLLKIFVLFTGGPKQNSLFARRSNQPSSSLATVSSTHVTVSS